MKKSRMHSNYKFWLLFFATVISGCSILGQEKTTKKDKTIYEQFSPPGTVHLRDSFYMDDSEIANIHYLEYLHHINRDSTKAFYLSQLPDSSTWETRLVTKIKYATNYFRFPGYRFYPVIGVSYEQAVNYCKWRSRMVNKVLQESNKKADHALKGYDVVVEFRLPTKEEWEYAAASGLDKNIHPYGLVRPAKGRKNRQIIQQGPITECLDSLKITYGRKEVLHKMEFTVLESFYLSIDKSGFRCSSSESLDPADDHIGPEYIYSNPPNKFRLYNMIGNVAEMIATEGVAKGGSFKHSLSEISISKDFHYDQPVEWVGFRSVAVVHLKKK